MEKDVEQVTNEIDQPLEWSGEERSTLTQCAVRIAERAITSFTGELREKALLIAKAIADFEDELTPQNKRDEDSTEAD